MRRLKIIYAMNAGNMAVLMLAQIAIVPVLLHYLGVQGYEDWMFLQSLGAALGILDLGLILYNSNTARIAFGEGDQAKAQLAVSHGLSFFMLFFFLFGLAALIIYAAGLSRNPLALALIVMAVPFSQLRTWFSYILTARLSQLWELGFFIAYMLVQTTVYVVTVIYGGNIETLAKVQLATLILLGAPPLILTLRRFAPDIKLIPRPVSRKEIMPMFKGCIANFGYSASAIAVTHIPVILLGILPGLPTGSLAIFTTSRTLTGVVRQFCQQLSRSNGIEISRHLSPSERPTMHRIFMLGAATTSVLAAIGIGGLLPIASVVIKVWTGKPELYDFATVCLLCVMALLSAQVQLPMVLPQFTNNARIMSKPLVMQVTLIVILGLSCGYYMGPAGMAFALGISELSTLGAVAIRKVLPQMGIDPWRFFLNSGLPGLVLFAFSMGASWLGRHLVDPQNFRGLALNGAIWAVFMAPVMLVTYRFAKRVKFRAA